MAIQLKGSKQYFPVMMYKMVLTFAPVDKNTEITQIEATASNLMQCCSFISLLTRTLRFGEGGCGGRMVQKGSNLQYKLKAICIRYGF